MPNPYRVLLKNGWVTRGQMTNAFQSPLLFPPLNCHSRKTIVINVDLQNIYILQLRTIHCPRTLDCLFPHLVVLSGSPFCALCSQMWGHLQFCCRLNRNVLWILEEFDFKTIIGSPVSFHSLRLRIIKEQVINVLCPNGRNQ